MWYKHSYYTLLRINSDNLGHLLAFHQACHHHFFICPALQIPAELASYPISTAEPPRTGFYNPGKLSQHQLFNCSQSLTRFTFSFFFYLTMLYSFAAAFLTTLFPFERAERSFFFFTSGYFSAY